MSAKVCFVTSNKGKLQEAEMILGISLYNQSVDLPELQLSTTQEVVKQKSKEAAKIIGGPVIVDDTGLHFNALGGLPGTYIRAFVDCMKPAEICKILVGFEDKSAVCACSIGFCAGPDAEPVVFTGEVQGTIVDVPRGGKGFGFDPIFQPKGYNQTYAEMDDQTKNHISHRFLAFNALRESKILNF